MALIKILLVDDDEMVRATLGEVLEQNGFAVTSAANVSEALKHISSQTFEVLLSDPTHAGGGRWLAELKFELRIGDPARIKAARARKQRPTGKMLSYCLGYR
jgi:DNA-binding NarL/FixJ family response regulator